MSFSKYKTDRAYLTQIISLTLRRTGKKARRRIEGFLEGVDFDAKTLTINGIKYSINNFKQDVRLREDVLTDEPYVVAFQND